MILTTLFTHSCNLQIHTKHTEWKYQAEHNNRIIIFSIKILTLNRKKYVFLHTQINTLQCPNQKKEPSRDKNNMLLVTCEAPTNQSNLEDRKQYNLKRKKVKEGFFYYYYYLGWQREKQLIITMTRAMKPLAHVSERKRL